MLAINLITVVSLQSFINAYAAKKPRFKEGEIVDIGRYWYRHENDRLVPMGCFSDDKTRLDINGSFRTRGFVLQCILDRNGDLRFRYKGCLSEDQSGEYGPNETWQDERYWYMCMVENDHLRAEVGGCVYKSVRYGIGGTVEMDGFLYECRRYANNTGSLCPVACIHNGQRYNVSQQFEIGQYWYTCTVQLGRIAKVCFGCLHKQQRLTDGDRYFLKDSVFQCEIRNNTAPDHKLIGCKDQTDDGAVIERNLGCEWTVGKFPKQYVMKCVKGGNGLAMKVGVRCYYDGFEMRPDCFRFVKDEVATCTLVDGQITLDAYPTTEALSVITKSRLEYCSSQFLQNSAQHW